MVQLHNSANRSSCVCLLGSTRLAALARSRSLLRLRAPGWLAEAGSLTALTVHLAEPFNFLASSPVNFPDTCHHVWGATGRSVWGWLWVLAA